MKRYHTGAQGESIQILQAAGQPVAIREQGFGSYQIMEYSRGVSTPQTIGARRVAEGWSGWSPAAGDLSGLTDSGSGLARRTQHGSMPSSENALDRRRHVVGG